MGYNIEEFVINNNVAQLSGVDISLAENKDTQQPASCKSVNEKLTELGVEILEEIGYKEQASGNVQIQDLNIKEGTNIRVIVDNGERVYQYFSVVIIENGESKTIAGGITQIGGVYSVDYKTEGVVSLVVVHYTGITVQSPVSLKVINKDSLGARLDDADKRISNLTNEFELEKNRSSETDNAIISEVRGRGVFVEDTEGIKELYIFDKSVNITDLHLLYNGGSSNVYSVVFFDGENRIAETQPEKSAIYGIQKIFMSDTLGSTDEVIGYIIVDWNAFKSGASAVIKGLKETCYNVNNSPRIYNFLQSLKMWGIEQDVWKPIKREMFDDLETLKTTLNEAFVEYAKLCKCSHYSFYSYEGVPAQLKYILPSINLNFRRKVIEETMTPQEMATAINYALTVPIERFNDAKLYNVSKETDMGWSINTGMPVGEPSAIVSEDGSTLYVYCGCLYRYKTTDGINYVKDADITLDGRHRPMSSEGYLMHCNVNYIDGVYYLIGTHDNYHPLVLWTSTDGVNFITQGTILNIGEEFNSKGQTIGNFGNTYLVKDSGKWYLYYEITYQGCKDWSNCLATCWNILEKEEDGTLGVWTQIPTNPIQDAANTFPLQSTRGYGNIDFARGENNLPIKYNGKYYIYYHGNANRGSLIFRGYSTDLINWTEEAMIYNNRDIPTAGATAPGNADHTIIQFKGRTLLFYTYDINDPNNEPVVKLMIDDRPIRELLTLMP